MTISHQAWRGEWQLLLSHEVEPSPGLVAGRHGGAGTGVERQPGLRLLAGAAAASARGLGALQRAGRREGACALPPRNPPCGNMGEVERAPFLKILKHV